MEDKVRENRLRRMVDRRGYRLEKSRRRDPDAYDYGTYHIIDPVKNFVVYMDWAWGRGYGLSLDDVEAWLKD